MKKAWKKPFLQVLVRGKLEESVLAPCKNTGSAVTASNATNNDCRWTDGCSSWCQENSAT